MLELLRFWHRNPFLRKCGRWLQVVFSAGYIVFGTVSLAEEDLNAGALRIVSEAGDCSAQIYIKEEENGPVSDEDKKKDKERSEIGMGETVTLTLVGKPQLIGDVSKVKWSIEKGEKLAYFNGPTTGTKTVTFIVKNDLKEKGEIKVKVTIENGGCLQLGLSAIVPTGIEAKHRRKSYDRNNLDFNKRGVPVQGFTVDGDQNMAGASAYLELTFLPKTVNFQNIQIIERDKGCTPAPARDNLAKDHVPNPNSLSPSNMNRLFDRIGARKLVTVLRQYTLPQSWVWKCDWNTYANGKDIITIRTVNQSFLHAWVTLNNIATTKVSKFGCSVTRSTEFNNKNQFN